MQMSLADLTSFSTAVNAFMNGRFDQILTYAEKTVKICYIMKYLVRTKFLYGWAQPCRCENNATMYSSRQPWLAAECFDMIWIRKQNGEVYPVDHISISIRACSPAVCTFRIPTLTTSTHSCILLGSQPEAGKHNMLLNGLNNQASILERTDRLITTSACLQILWSHLLVHSLWSYSRGMITLVNSKVFDAMSADG